MPRNASVRVDVSNCAILWFAHTPWLGNHMGCTASWFSLLFCRFSSSSRRDRLMQRTENCPLLSLSLTKGLPLQHSWADCLRVEEWKKGKSMYPHLSYSQSLLITFWSGFTPLWFFFVVLYTEECGAKCGASFRLYFGASFRVKKETWSFLLKTGRCSLKCGYIHWAHPDYSHSDPSLLLPLLQPCKSAVRRKMLSFTLFEGVGELQAFYTKGELL